MMWRLLKNARIFTPEPIREKDILLMGGKIAAVGDNLAIPDFGEGEELDLEGTIVVPGFIDAHVHICGGGGEDGPTSRTPEIQLTQLTGAGITTVVGLLGTDTVSRSMRELFVKARALEFEGLTTYIYSGGYQLPIRTLTEGVREDLVLIDKVIGAGEIAISDHRSAQPQLAELERLAAEVRAGGMLGKKAGIIHLHMGEGKRGLGTIWDILDQTEIPITQFVPTHMNRTPNLLEEGMKFLQAGGQIDLTAGCEDFAEELQVPAVLSQLAKANLLHGHVTVSSDANGSMPQFNEKGQLIGMGVGSANVLWKDIREAVLNYHLPLETALQTITENAARVLKLSNKGSIETGKDADLVVLDRDYQICHVWAKGQWMVKEGKPIVWGTYEKDKQGEDLGQRDGRSI